MTASTTENAPPTWELRHRLARAMESASVSREQMAHELGCTPQTISNYINGRTVPPRGYLRVWAEVTKTPMSWLVEDDPGTHPVSSRQVLAYVA